MRNEKLNIYPSLSCYQNKFIIYVRTLQYWNHLKEGKEAKEFVNIPFKVINEKFKLKSIDLKLLIELKFIESKEQISKKGIIFYQYRTILKGPFSLDLLTSDSNNQTSIHNSMKEYLKAVSIASNSNCTEYFKLFLMFKHINIDLFFSVDYFGNRVHTPVTILDLKFRDTLLLKGEKTASIDVGTMQPLLLAEILKKNIGANMFTDLVYNEDIYLYLQDKAHLETRADAKTYFYKIAFGKPDEKLKEYFGNENWIDWINELKSKPLESNPKKDKVHNNLAFLLQSTEVNIMTEIWQNLANNEIYFLSVHDEVIVREKDLIKAKEIFISVLNKHFIKYKLNINHNSIQIDNLLNSVDLKLNNSIETLEPEKIPIEPISNFKVKENEFNNDIQDLEQYFDSIEIPIGPVQLNQYMNIFNLSKFIQCDLNNLKTYKDNSYFLPHLERLQTIKQYLEHGQ